MVSSQGCHHCCEEGPREGLPGKRAPNIVSTCASEQPLLPLKTSKYWKIFNWRCFRLSLDQGLKRLGHIKNIVCWRGKIRWIVLGTKGRVPTLSFVLSLMPSCRTPCPNSLAKSLKFLASAPRETSFFLEPSSCLKLSCLFSARFI